MIKEIDDLYEMCIGDDNNFYITKEDYELLTPIILHNLQRIIEVHTIYGSTVITNTKNIILLHHSTKEHRDEQVRIRDLIEAEYDKKEWL